jgi:hypothetical protein
VNAGSAHLFSDGKGVKLLFELASGGGGITVVQCNISVDSFTELAELMMSENPVAATRAFAGALRYRDFGEKVKDVKPLR